MQTVRLGDIKVELENAIAKGQIDPIRVQQDGRDVAIILSPVLYSALLAETPAGVNPRVAALFKRSLVEHAQVYRALARYEAEHPEPEQD